MRHPLRWAGWIAALLVAAVLLTQFLTRPEPDPGLDLRPPSGAPTIGTGGAASTAPAPLPPNATAPPRPRATPLAHTWQARSKVLRPELENAELYFAPDNIPGEDHAVIAAGRTWVVMTGEGIRGTQTRAEDTRVKLHGLAAATGRQQWSLPMSFGLCASELLDQKLACASAEARDAATGLPTRWKLQLVDPATGTVGTTRVVDGWFTSASVAKGRLVLVEQRQPAPHAVVRAFDASLRPLWERDLANHPGHEGLFSTNRYITRLDLTVPTGPALHALRPRVVGGMLALWGRPTSAFVDLASGELRGLRECSPMVDDGDSLWCGQADGVVALDHILGERFRVPGVSLVFPRHDRRHGRTSQPWFANQAGSLVRVNPSTGAVGEVLVQTSVDSSPSTAAFQAGSTTLVDDARGTVALEVGSQQPLWASSHYLTMGAVLSHGRHLVVAADGFVDVVDPATGRTIAHHDKAPGFSLQGVGTLADDALVSIGLDGVSRVRLR